MREDFLKLDKYTNVVVWGCGNFFERFAEKLVDDATHLVDNNECKWGQHRGRHTIQGTQVLKQLNPEKTLVIVTISNFEEVYEQIISYGHFNAISIFDYRYLRDNMKKQVPFSGGKYVLSLAIGNAVLGQNGAQKFIRNQNRIIKERGYQVLQGIPIMYLNCGNQRTEILVMQEGEFAGIYTVDGFVETVREVNGIIIHSLVYGYQMLETLVEKVCNKGNILYYLHDYLCISANRFLYKEKQECRGFREECQKCRKYNICKDVHSFHKRFFEKNHVQLIAPSDCTRDIVADIYKNVDIYTIGHLKYKTTIKTIQSKGKIRLAYLGTPNEKKGWNDFLYLAKRVKNEYELFLLGCGYDKKNALGIKCIDIGQDREAGELTMIEALEKYAINIAFLGSKVKETYSYTYYEAYEAGTYVLTTETSGNIADTVKKNANGMVFRDVEGIIEFLDSHVEMFKEKHTVPQIIDVQADDSFMDILFKRW